MKVGSRYCKLIRHGINILSKACGVEIQITHERARQRRAIAAAIIRGQKDHALADPQNAMDDTTAVSTESGFLSDVRFV